MVTGTGNYVVNPLLERLVHVHSNLYYS